MPSQETKHNNEDVPGNPVTLDHAISGTTRWRDFLNSFDKSTTPIPQNQKLKAFLIPIADIQALAASQNAANVRAYLSLTATPEDGTSAMRLFLVAVGEDGNDIIEPIDPGDPTGLYTIYDFTSPCPNFCDIQSPLF